MGVTKETIIEHFRENFTDFYRRYINGDLKKRNGELWTCCVFHEEKDASFSFKPETGVYSCFGCKEGGDIFSFYAKSHGLNVKADFPKVLEGIAADFGIRNGHTQATQPKMVKAYDYFDAAGDMIFQVLRWEPGFDGKKKSFSQRRTDGKGGWITKGVFKGFDPVLYRLPEVLKADEVIIVEGEKDADNLATMGFTATCNPMGAEKWREHYSEHLKGKRVVIIPDQDEPGEKHLNQVARSLAGAGIEARVVRLPEGTKDISDLIATLDKAEAAERLSMMIDGAEPWEPGEKAEPEAETAGPPPKSALQITPGELAAAKLTPACVVKNYLYCDVGCLTAPGGSGKTTQALYEMTCIALGRQLYGLKICRPGWSLYVTAEDNREILVARLREIMAAMDLTSKEQRAAMETVLIWDVTGEALKLIKASDGNIELTSLADDIVSAYKYDPPVLVTFDPAISFGASEGMVNDNENGLITAARRIVRGLGCCVRYIAHTGKMNARGKTIDQYTSRGGSALPDGTRMTAVMQTWQQGDERKLPAGLIYSPESSITYLARPKLSYAPPNLPLIWVKRTGWAFEYVIEIPVSEEDRGKALLDQVERFIHSEVMAGHYHSKKSLCDSMAQFNLKRAAVRSAIDLLIAYGRVSEADLPKGVGKGNWKTYLTKTELAKNEKTDGELVENSEESQAELAELK